MAPAAAHASEGLANPYDLDAVPPFWRRKNGILLYFALTSSLLATASLGIDGVCCQHGQDQRNRSKEQIKRTDQI